MRRRSRGTRSGSRWTAAVLLAVAASTGPAAPAPLAGQDGGVPQGLPRVLVLATGGTIASRPDAPNLPGTELVGAVPALAEHARITVEQVVNIGSSGMTPGHWLRLARRVGDAFADDPGLAGIVITHGTDSMDETAYFLHLTVGDPRPVVLVGSMRSATAVSADGPANLVAAVRTAVHPDARGRGVMVVLNDWIHSARDVRKMDDNRVDAFRSEWGPLGLVDQDAVVFRRSLDGVEDRPVFELIGVEALPEVHVVADYTGYDGETLRFRARNGAAGIVVQTFAGGRTSPGASRAVAEVAAGGTPVVLASRVPEGRVMTRDGAAESGVVTAGDREPWKARVLLMLALTRTEDPVEIQRLFDRH